MRISIAVLIIVTLSAVLGCTQAPEPVYVTATPHPRVAAEARAETERQMQESIRATVAALVPTQEPASSLQTKVAEILATTQPTEDILPTAPPQGGKTSLFRDPTPPATITSQASDLARVALERGIGLAKNGDYPEALEELETAQRLHGGSSEEAEAWLSWVQKELGNTEAAIRHQENAQALREGNGQPDSTPIPATPHPETVITTIQPPVAPTPTPSPTTYGAGKNCDQLLRNQLVFQKGASTAGRMKEVIRQIQAQRDDCVPELWSPVVDDATAVLVTGCHGSASLPLYANPLVTRIGDLTIPRGLYTGADPAKDTVRKTSGRDSDNNIIVYWSAEAGRTPADGAKCWLHVSRLNSWDENFGEVDEEGLTTVINPIQPPGAPTPAPTTTPTPAPPTPAPTPAPTQIPVHFLTAEDAIPEWAYENHPALIQYILDLPWTSGKLTALEINTIELLLRYAVVHSNAIEHAKNEHLLTGPDPFAMDIIQRTGFFESAPEVTDPRRIQVEQRLINLPLRGQTNLLILRAQPGSEVAMDLLESSVRSAERFMNIPFPTDQVTLQFTKLNVTEGYRGSFMPSFPGGTVQILPRYDQHALVTTHYSPGNEKELAEIIAHEVAHYYWHHHASWIDEGMAETLESHIENDRVGTPVALSGPECRWYPAIIFLENHSPPLTEYAKFLCNYTLGQSLFLAIEASIGKEEFIQGARRLYKTRTAPHIESVRAAFPNSGDTPEIIKYHYYGDPDFYDEANPPPSLQLPTIKLTSASLQLERSQTLPPWDRTPLSSFSASRYHGPIMLFVTVPPLGQGSQPYVTLTVEHPESAWSEQRIIEAVGLPESRSSTRHEIGPRRTPWTPGKYLASIEQYGKKLAEISWTVTP